MDRRRTTGRWPGWRRGFPAVAVILVVFAGCAAAAAASSGAGKPVLRIGLSGDRFNADPAKDSAQFVPGWDLTNEPILVEEPDGSFSPGLATSWHYLKAPRGSGLANKGFEFTLRHNARFSDGKPVTAAAVKTWIDYVAGASAQFASNMGPLSSVETVGKWTVRIHVKSPNPIMRLTLSGPNWGWVSSPAAVANPSLFQNGSYGAGPFMLDAAQTVPGDHYTLVPNPYYYDKSKQYWSKVVVKIITSPTSMLQAIQAGQLDYAAGDPTTAAAASSAGLSVLHGGGGIQTFWLDANGAKVKALADVRVRQALNYAIDRKTIAAAIVGKYGYASSEFVTLDGFDPKSNNSYPYNPTKAKALLAAAGYAHGLTIGPAAVCACFGVLGLPLGQAVAKYLAAVGVTLDLKVDSTYPAFIPDLVSDPAPMFLAGAGLSPMWLIYTLIIKPGAILNTLGGGWKDKTLFDLWVKASRAADPVPYWQQLTDRVAQQAYFLNILVNENIAYVNAKKLKGVTVTRYEISPDLQWAPK